MPRRLLLRVLKEAMKILAKDLKPGQTILVPAPGWLFDRKEEEVDVAVVVARIEANDYGTLRIHSTLGNTYIVDPEGELKVQQ